jgi:hypothetical protein
MSNSKSNKRTCSNGHIYYKTSDCPTCPICEAAHKPVDGFMAPLSAPARRALEHAGIDTVEKLSAFSEKQILQLHGIGPAALPILRKALQKAQLGFKT